MCEYYVTKTLILRANKKGASIQIYSLKTGHYKDI